MSSWSGPPRIFTQVGSERVNNVFVAAYDSTNNLWRYPIFFSPNDYTGATTPISITLVSGKVLNGFVSDSNTISSTVKPERFPIAVSRSCSQKCIRSSSENLQHRKRENLLLAVQNGGVRSPFDDYSKHLSYKKATQLIVPQYTC